MSKLLSMAASHEPLAMNTIVNTKFRWWSLAGAGCLDRLRQVATAAVQPEHGGDGAATDSHRPTAGNRQYPGGDVRHAGRPIRTARRGIGYRQDSRGGWPGAERRVRQGDRLVSPAVRSLSRHDRRRTAAPRRRFSILIRATIGRASSSSNRPSGPPNRPTPIWKRCCDKACRGRRCRRSICCPTRR